jgi:hypothetical protein
MGQQARAATGRYKRAQHTEKALLTRNKRNSAKNGPTFRFLEQYLWFRENLNFLNFFIFSNKNSKRERPEHSHAAYGLCCLTDHDGE